MHNLTPSVGEVNADRSNFRFGMLPDAGPQHGACDFRVDFQQRVAQPREEIRGLFARIYFYMHDRYDLRMSRQQEQLMMAWDRMHPVTAWERERDSRIAAIMGHSNPFVTGERTWIRGHRNTGDGLPDGAEETATQVFQRSQGPVIGNTRSGVYHLPHGCPSYSRVGEQNRREFEDEDAAVAAGFRKAGNCR